MHVLECQVFDTSGNHGWIVVVGVEQTDLIGKFLERLVAFRRHCVEGRSTGTHLVILDGLAVAGDLEFPTSEGAVECLDEGRPGIVRKPRKNNLADCSERKNEARAGFHRPALLN